MMRISEDSTASAERLWTYLGDVEHWGDRLPTFDSVRHVGGPVPTNVGSRFEVRQPGLARATYEITRWEPDHGFTWVGRMPGVATTGIHDLEPAGRGCRITLGIEWSGPLARAVRLLMASKARRMMQSECETIVRLAERD
ncbi:MAG TPA: SRPBCC family protein [Flexivirga sp.]|uniref:SRPBCC family protein n=1 Tax=Flexivirga sp. TaxID=1962927 RepID=UPI002BE885B2|nr:SRPBCC family protein [Flexivirga sp.]HWC24287.1 SRPBCC family protein [Flexivirga sp.]